MNRIILLLAAAAHSLIIILFHFSGCRFQINQNRIDCYNKSRETHQGESRHSNHNWSPRWFSIIFSSLSHLFKITNLCKFLLYRYVKEHTLMELSEAVIISSVFIITSFISLGKLKTTKICSGWLKIALWKQKKSFYYQLSPARTFNNNWCRF